MSPDPEYLAQRVAAGVVGHGSSYAVTVVDVTPPE